MVVFGIVILAQSFLRGEVGQVLWVGLVLVLGDAVFGGYQTARPLAAIDVFAGGFCRSPRGPAGGRSLGKIRVTRLSRRRVLGLDAGAFSRRWRARAGAGEPSGGDAEGVGPAGAGIRARG